MNLKFYSQNIRINILKMLYSSGSGHLAGALGMTDIFVALYFQILKHKPYNPTWNQRDYLLVSNGHIVPVWYATLAEAGYFPQSELFNLRQLGSRLQGHPVKKYLSQHNLPGIENTSGPLGQGVSQAVGLALGLKKDNKPNRIICITSDGEQQEGQVWEAYMLAYKYKLNNLTYILDRNNIQIDGFTRQVMPLENLRLKYESFGLNVIEINGHDYNEIINVFESNIGNNANPNMVIVHTTPGKGVSFMENNYKWHGKVPNDQELDIAIKELLIN